jgi:hypothetical protein
MAIQEQVLPYGWISISHITCTYFHHDVFDSLLASNLIYGHSQHINPYQFSLMIQQLHRHEVQYS